MQGNLRSTIFAILKTGCQNLKTKTLKVDRRPTGEDHGFIPRANSEMVDSIVAFCGQSSVASDGFRPAGIVRGIPAQKWPRQSTPCRVASRADEIRAPIGLHSFPCKQRWY